MAADGPLAFISDTFNIETCTGQTKLLRDCTVWELLNFQVETIVEIPERLYKEYRISSQYLESAMSNYLIQTISKDEIMKKWGIQQQPVIFLPATKHYSWPKDAGECVPYLNPDIFAYRYFQRLLGSVLAMLSMFLSTVMHAWI